MLSVTVEDLQTACSSKRFVSLVRGRGPFEDTTALIHTCRHVWWQQAHVEDWLAAFAAHPRIGDLNESKAQHSQFAKLSETEQASAATASGDVLQELRSCNEAYEAKFGHTFIVCATGKSAAEMLCLVKARLLNSPHEELLAAAREQMKITELRLQKMVATQEGRKAQNPDATATAERRAGGTASLRSPITTHVLDTSMGKPAPDVPISLQRQCHESTGVWDCIASGTTNSDGRIGDLLPASDFIEPGSYKVTFDMTSYMNDCKRRHPNFFPDQPFYPKVDVHFNITLSQVKQHFHIPLTWNPYGYSTYRGS